MEIKVVNTEEIEEKFDILLIQKIISRVLSTHGEVTKFGEIVISNMRLKQNTCTLTYNGESCEVKFLTKKFLVLSTKGEIGECLSLENAFTYYTNYPNYPNKDSEKIYIVEAWR